MKMNFETWLALSELARAGVQKWRARAVEKGRSDKFDYELHVGNDNPYRVIETRHETEFEVERKGVAYNLDTNTLHAARFIKKKGWQIKPPPKAWAKLEGKPIEEIYKKLPLNDFFMVLSARVTGVTSSSYEDRTATR
jgi:hypothetical protein